MLKRKASKSVLTIDQIMNDINAWVVDEDCNWNKVEDDLDDLCGELDEKNEDNSDHTEQFILESEVIENTDDREEQPLNLRQRYQTQKQLTCNRKVYATDSSSDKGNIEKIIYLNRDGNFEEYVGYVVPKNY